ncbi:MAG: radical SAM protein [Myxococcota bacterium]
MALHIDHRSLYRLPWNLADNPIVWLEPTDHCNLQCDGCYRKNEPKHKSLQEIGKDLDVFESLRKFDSVSIAGGDPLMHPEVLDIVRMIKLRGAKPVLNTNGHALTRELLRDLKRAGLFGLTLHVDSKQGRPDWKGADEVKMNQLRSTYADMVASAGGLACSFNSTVYPDTLDQVPAVVDWAQREIDKVQTVVFIIFRHADLSSGSFDYWAGDRKIHMDELVYAEKEKRRIDIMANDVVERIRQVQPDFAPCAYLNGTERPDSFKWLLALRTGNKKRIYGYAGAKWMEATQSAMHLLQDRYVAYVSPNVTAKGKASMLLGAAFDPASRRAALRFGRSLIRHPLDLARRAHAQSILIIQPIDIFADGRQSMCDGCPDVTVHDGKLVWSCRLEELRKFGQFVRTVPQREEVVQQERPAAAAHA